MITSWKTRQALVSGDNEAPLARLMDGWKCECEGIGISGDEILRYLTKHTLIFKLLQLLHARRLQVIFHSYDNQGESV